MGLWFLFLLFYLLSYELNFLYLPSNGCPTVVFLEEITCLFHFIDSQIRELIYTRFRWLTWRFGTTKQKRYWNLNWCCYRMRSSRTLEWGEYILYLRWLWITEATCDSWDCHNHHFLPWSLLCLLLCVHYVAKEVTYKLENREIIRDCTDM